MMTNSQSCDDAVICAKIAL